MQKVSSFEEAFANYVANKPAIKPPSRPFGSLMRNHTIATLMRGNQEDLEMHHDALAKETMFNAAAERIARENKYPLKVIRTLAHAKKSVDVSPSVLPTQRQKVLMLESKQKKEDEEQKNANEKRKRADEAVQKVKKVPTFNIYTDTEPNPNRIPPPFSDDSPISKRQKMYPNADEEAEDTDRAQSAPETSTERGIRKEARDAEAKLGMPISPENQFKSGGTLKKYKELYASVGQTMPPGFTPIPQVRKQTSPRKTRKIARPKAQPSDQTLPP